MKNITGGILKIYNTKYCYKEKKSGQILIIYQKKYIYLNFIL